MFRYNLVGFDHKLRKFSKYAKFVERETSKNSTTVSKMKSKFKQSYLVG